MDRKEIKAGEIYSWWLVIRGRRYFRCGHVVVSYGEDALLLQVFAASRSIPQCGIQSDSGIQIVIRRRQSFVAGLNWMDSAESSSAVRVFVATALCFIRCFNRPDSNRFTVPAYPCNNNNSVTTDHDEEWFRYLWIYRRYSYPNCFCCCGWGRSDGVRNWSGYQKRANRVPWSATVWASGWKSLDAANCEPFPLPLSCSVENAYHSALLRDICCNLAMRDSDGCSSRNPTFAISSQTTDSLLIERLAWLGGFTSFLILLENK